MRGPGTEPRPPISLATPPRPRPSSPAYPINHMKQLIAAGALLACLGGPASAGGKGWTSDFEAAKQQATEEKKDLLIDFTGSDWCGWCIKLVDEVFSKDEFTTGVKDKFVLVEIDFPQDESKLDAKTKAQNEKLQGQYAIQGFPTIVLADAGGRPYATTGYHEGGAPAYVKHLDELRARRAARDEAFKQAEAAAGPAKAKALLAALKGLPDEMIPGFYGDVIEQIKKADPGDESGFVKAQERKAAMAKIEQGVQERLSNEDLDGALTFLTKEVDQAGLEGEQKQQALAMKIIILANQGKFDESIAALDEIKALAPESELAGQLTKFRGRLEQAKEEHAEPDAKKDAGDAPDAQPPPPPKDGAEQPAAE